LQITTEEERNSLWNTLKNSRQHYSYPEDVETMSATCIEGWVDEQMKEINCIKDDFGIIVTSSHSVLPIMEEILSKMENSPLSDVNQVDLPNGGGCLIATATYGSELSPQVQQLRELRDNKLLQTESGSAFMESFNDFYYSFSPIIADYERENTVFREAVKLAITPMISSLSILNYVDMETEAEFLGYGISLILLNVGMYVGVPVMVVVGIRKRF